MRQSPRRRIHRHDQSGVSHSLHRLAPGKQFYFVANELFKQCPYMKLNAGETARRTALEPRVGCHQTSWTARLPVGACSRYAKDLS